AFVDCAALLDFGFHREEVLDRPTALVGADEQVGALLFDTGASSVMAATDVVGVRPADPAALHVDFTLSPGLEPPIAAGDPVGTVEVRTPSGVVGSTDAIAASSVPGPGPGWVVDLLASMVEVAGSILGPGP
ncbi:MAG TPA: hypothetical protein VFK89_02760, partial [Actinomycetota bacterium]|nr:hypothetical protein [Actinomycetota bacterium]